MKILVTGARGQPRSQLINVLKSGYSEIGQISPIYMNADIIGIDLEDLDITVLKFNGLLKIVANISSV